MTGFSIGLDKDANLSDLADLAAGAATLGLSAASLDIAADLSSLGIQSSGFNALTGLTGNVQAQIDAQRATLFGLLADTADYLHLGGSTLTTAAVSGAVAANLFLDASLNPVTTSTDSFWYSSTAGEIEYPARVEVGGTLQVDSLSLPDASAISDLSNLAGDYGFITFNESLELTAGGNAYRALVAPGPTVEQYFKDDKSLINRVSQAQDVTYTRASKALYRNAHGLFAEAANGEPRFDHDANGQCLGLLIEPQRTNYIRYSELTTPDQLTDPQRQGVQYRVLTGLFDRPINAAYFPPSIFGMDGPNGLTGTNSNATRSAILTFFTATSFSVGTLAISFYLYSDEVPLGLNVFLVRNNGLINLSSFLIKRLHLGGGLYRYTYVYPWSTLNTSGTLSGLRVGHIYTKSSGNLFVGPNKGFYVFGGQIESGSFVSSYIRTNGAQATRSADALTLTGATLDASGTLEVKASPETTSSIFRLSSATQEIEPNSSGGLSIDGTSLANAFTGTVQFSAGVDPDTVRLKYDVGTPRSFYRTALPRPAAAFSLRDLTGTNPVVVRIRRSNDNSERDFRASEITDGTLIAWVGSVSGLVSTWYDQLTGGFHAARQSTQSRQPALVINGVLQTEGGKPAINFDGSNDFLQSSLRGVQGMDTFSFFSVYRTKDRAATARVIVGMGHPGSQGGGGWGLGWFGAYDQAAYFGAGGSTTGVSGEVQQLTSLIATAAASTVYRNGAQLGLITTPPAVTFANVGLHALLRFGTNHQFQVGPQTFRPMFFQEFLFYFSDQTDNRTIIEANINNHYGIYTPNQAQSVPLFTVAKVFETTAAIPATDTLTLLPNGVGHIGQLRVWPFQCSDNFVAGGVVT